MSGRSIAGSEVRVPMLNIMLAQVIAEERRREVESNITHRRLLDELRQHLVKARPDRPARAARQDRVAATP